MTRLATPTALASALSAALLMVTSAAAAGDDGLQVNELEGAQFPDRAFLLTLPSEQLLAEGSVQVRENGERVSDVTLLPARLAGEGEFAVALVLDASRSMRGKAILGAIEAARAFAARRNENQQIALITFNTETKVVLPLTVVDSEVDAALTEPPPLASATRLYDAIETALDLLEQEDVTAGSILVLSDGRDAGSRATAEQVTARARQAGVRIFTVGLRSRHFTPAALEELAGAANGTYSEAASANELEAIFDALGSRLANEYVLRYRSKARPGAQVRVSVSVTGIEGIAVGEYVAPPLAGGTGRPFHRSFAERYWRSTEGMIVTTLLFSALVAVVLMSVLRPRRRTLRKRMAEFVSVAVADEAKNDRKETDVALARAERTLERTRWWTQLKQKLELAEIRTPAFHVVLGTTVGTAMAVFVAHVVGGFLFAPLGLAVPFVVRSAIARKVEKKRKLFADQLPDNLQVLSSALRAGHSLVGALSVVVDDCPEPSRREFRRIVADEQLGVPLEDAIGVVSRRMDSRDLEQVGLVAALQRETGGNTAEVLDRVADTVRSRFELRRLVRTLTTQGRMSRWVVSLLPVGLLALITAINPEYMKPLYAHPVGRALLLVAGVMVVAGSLVIKRIIDIKV